MRLYTKITCWRANPFFPDSFRFFCNVLVAYMQYNYRCNLTFTYGIRRSTLMVYMIFVLGVWFCCGGGGERRWLFSCFVRPPPIWGCGSKG